MSKKFVPPKLDMGPGFATASSIKAKHKSQASKEVSTSTPTPDTKSTTKSKKGKAQTDALPLTIENLSLFFDWRRGQFEQSPTLYKLASIIWLYLPEIPQDSYTINFASAKDNSVMEKGGNMMAGPPAIITTSPKGDLLVMVENNKQLFEYSEKQFLLILYPYIDNIKFIDDASVKTSGGEHCTYWEIDGIEHLTHIVMDKYGIIYFTTGESVYRIIKTEGDMYLDNYEDIFTPSNDTSHITCLWRQNNDIFITIQDWDNETNLDVYKLRPPQNKGVSTVSTPDSPTTDRKPSFGSYNSGKSGKRKRTRSRSNSGYGSGYGSDYGGASPRSGGTANDSNEFMNKVRTFSLMYNSRIWQLGSMRYEKKFVLAIGAAQMGNHPELLQIGFKKKIKPLPLMGSGKKNIIWPKSSPDEVPHSIYQHKQTKSWFCILPVTSTKFKDGRLFWVQFRMDKTKKKITWQRLVPVPEESKEGEWLYYDEQRDVLIGFQKIDMDENEYVFKFLPDMTKHLWVEPKSNDDDDSKTQPEMQMQRSFRQRRKSKEKPSLKRQNSGSNKPRMDNTTTSNESNIKPSKAKKERENESQRRKPKKTKKKSVHDVKSKSNGADKKSDKDKVAKKKSVDVAKIKPKKKATKSSSSQPKSPKPPAISTKNSKKGKTKNGVKAKTPKTPKTPNGALADAVKPATPLTVQPVKKKKKDNKKKKGTKTPTPSAEPKENIPSYEDAVKNNNAEETEQETPAMNGGNSNSKKRKNTAPPDMDEDEDVMD